MRQRTAVLAITPLTAALLTLAPGASAAAAPRAVVVPCGTTLTTSVRLAADVVCPEGGGLQLARDGIELNLNGHSVTGPGAGTDSSGVFFAARDVTVRNGTISGWGTGVTANYSNDDGPVSVSGTVREARLQGNGVGVDSEQGGDVVVRNSLLSGNSRGGVAVFDGRLRVERSTAEANQTGFFTFSINPGDFVVRDSLIRGNRGAGISCSQDGRYDVDRTTLQRNGTGLDVFECGGIVQNSKFIWNRQHVGGFLVEGDRIDLVCNSYTRDGGPVEFPVQPCPAGVSAPVIAEES